jgi:hypothetical protein
MGSGAAPRGALELRLGGALRKTARLRLRLERKEGLVWNLGV